MRVHVVKRDNCPLWKKMLFYVAAVALAGESLGAGQKEMAKRYGSICQRIGLLISFILALLLFFGGRCSFFSRFRGNGCFLCRDIQFIQNAVRRGGKGRYGAGESKQGGADGSGFFHYTFLLYNKITVHVVKSRWCAPVSGQNRVPDHFQL